MAYFPFFMELEGRPGLIVGGGAVALRKIQKLLPYGPVLTVVAPTVSPEIQAIPGLRLAKRPFVPEDVCGAAFVIAATDQREVNHRVAQTCTGQKIPVNVADDEGESSFLFPALVKRGPLSVGISTGGGSPTAARYLKEQIAKLIPEHMEEILDSLHRWRGAIVEAPLSEGQRRALLKELFAASLTAGRALTEEEVMERWNAVRSEGERK